MKFLPWTCKCRTSACLLALVLIWTCTSVHAGAPCENNCLQIDNHQADCEVIGCRNGCKPGWYGSLCNKRCSRRCQDMICNQIDGKCIKGCIGRWFCRESSRNRVLRDIDPVNKRCLRKSVDNQKTCECCIPRYRGPNCSIFCEKCDTFEESDLCEYMCEGGYYGDTCNMTCSENCATGILGTHLCEATGDGIVQCSDGCIRGRYGTYCNYSCSQSCKNNTCYRKNGTCAECPDNRYGSYCNISCSEKCIDDRCQRNGTCIDGCKEGYSGLKCDQKCSVNCTGAFCYQNGTCWPSCGNGFYGEQCQMKCGQNCLNSSCQAQTVSGDLTFACTLGCEDGYMGSQCQEQCPEHCTNCSKLPHFSACKHTAGNHGGVEKGSSRLFLWWHVVVPIIIALVIVIIIVISCKKRGHCFKRRETQTDGKLDVNEHLFQQIGTGTKQHPGDEGKHRNRGNAFGKPSTERQFSFKRTRAKFQRLSNTDANEGDKRQPGTPAEGSRNKLKCKELDRPTGENRNLTESGFFDKTDAKRDENTEENKFTDGYTNDQDKGQSSRPVEISKSEAKCGESNTTPAVENMDLAEIGPSDKPDAKGDENTGNAFGKSLTGRQYSFKTTRAKFQRPSNTDANEGDKRQPGTPAEGSRNKLKCKELNRPTGVNRNLTESGPSDKTDAKRDENTVERSETEANCRETNTRPTVENMNLSGPSDRPDGKRDENTDVLDAPSGETNQLQDQARRDGDL